MAAETLKERRPLTVRRSFHQQKARLYLAWTGLAWTWEVAVPDVRWCCGYESFSLRTFTDALSTLNEQIAIRRHAVHPWNSPAQADDNWLEWQ